MLTSNITSGKRKARRAIVPESPSKTPKKTTKIPLQEKSPERITRESTPFTHLSSSDDEDEALISQARQTHIIGDSHSRRWETDSKEVYLSKFPSDKTTSNWSIGGEKAEDLALKVNKNPELYADGDTEMVILHTGSNDLLKDADKKIKPKDLAKKIEEVAGYLKGAAPQATIFVCTLPPVRDTKEARGDDKIKLASDKSTRAHHEGRRTSTNEWLHELAKNEGTPIAAVLHLPECLESGDEENYRWNDNVHFSDHAYGQTIEEHATQIAEYFRNHNG